MGLEKQVDKPQTSTHISSYMVSVFGYSSTVRQPRFILFTYSNKKYSGKVVVILFTVTACDTSN